MQIRVMEALALEPGEHHVTLHKAQLQRKITRNGDPYQAVRLEFSDARGGRAGTFLPEFSRATLPFLTECGLTLEKLPDLQLEQLLNMRGVQGIAWVELSGQYSNVVRFRRCL